ncbi:hypothetical protein BBJ28_00021256 [Nothophytophthora sp. Chile5]|nr:hypothetical protein BBJ28_00021256 [Nothophytophthora sp. Chile5]
MKSRVAFATTALLFAVSFDSTIGKQAYLSELPNGSSFSMELGHPGGESSQYTDFADAFSSAGASWTAALCAATFPGSSMTNGAAFGDPCCTWSKGGTPDFTVTAFTTDPTTATTCASSSTTTSTAASTTSSTAASSTDDTTPGTVAPASDTPTTDTPSTSSEATSSHGEGNGKSRGGKGGSHHRLRNPVILELDQPNFSGKKQILGNTLVLLRFSHMTSTITIS